jgi:hypothetical protein
MDKDPSSGSENSRAGTPVYLAPEALQGAPTTNKIDIYRCFFFSWKTWPVILMWQEACPSTLSFQTDAHIFEKSPYTISLKDFNYYWYVTYQWCVFAWIITCKFWTVSQSSCGRCSPASKHGYVLMPAYLSFFLFFYSISLVAGSHNILKSDLLLNLLHSDHAWLQADGSSCLAVSIFPLVSNLKKISHFSILLARMPKREPVSHTHTHTHTHTHYMCMSLFD